MQRKTKRTITMVMVLISVLLLVSPVVLAKVGWKINDVGLKSVQIRATIYEDGAPGPQHGRISASIREIQPEIYSYKFTIDLKKASKNEEYNVLIWADLPDISFTIYGDLTNPQWYFIEYVAVNFLHIDLDFKVNGEITTSLGLLGLMGPHEQDTGITLLTDGRGFNKTVKTGIMPENDAMEYILDLTWPFFREYLIAEVPGLELSEEIDFADLGITGMTMHGETFTISMGVRFVSDLDSYSSEDIVIDRTWNDFVWVA